MREFGLIGRHLPHSFSAKYFAAKFEREAIDDAHYALYEMESVEGVEQLLKLEGLVGFNITIPYKLDILRYTDYLSAEAEAIGAVNCLHITERGRIGYNTDAIGFRTSLLEFLDGAQIDGALVLGSGGASLAVKYVLRELEIPYLQISRRSGEGCISYDEISAEIIDSHHLIINATPLGTYPEVESAPEIPYSLLTSRHYLYDLVYNPPLTKFLASGRARGAKTCNGEQMLIGQAEAAWEIWNG